MEWQKIETAPKDDEFYCMGKHGHLYRVTHFNIPGYKNAVIEKWSGRWWNPKHYLPLNALPTPPKDTGEC